MLGLKSLFGKESGKPKMLYEELGGKVLIVDHDPLIGRDLGAIFKLQLGLNSDVVESIDDARMLMMTNCYDACVLEPFG